MDTTTLQGIVANESYTANGNLWPNSLGFDAIGADGREYEVWFPIDGTWRVRSFDRSGAPEFYGTGSTALAALANCVVPIE